jgi:hypothetical protein
MWAGEEWALAEVGKITDAEFWRRVGAWFGLKEDEQVAALREEFWQTWIVDEKVRRWSSAPAPNIRWPS